MKKLLITIILISLVSCGAEKNENAESTAGRTIEDDLGRKVEIAEIPDKVVSLAPNLTEMIYALGAGDKLAGNTRYCNYPEEAKSVTKVGDLLSVNYEKIVSLQPDMIILTVEGNTKDTFEKLTELGFTVFVSNPRDFDGIKKSARDLGDIFHTEKRADSLVAAWDKKVVNLAGYSEKFKGKQALFLVSLKPVMAAGPNTFINGYLEKLGIKNAAAGTKVNYPVFSREEILKINPDYIIYTGQTKEEEDIAESYPEWENLEAVKNGNIIGGNADLYFRPGPRYAEALEDLVNRLLRREGSRRQKP